MGGARSIALGLVAGASLMLTPAMDDGSHGRRAAPICMQRAVLAEWEPLDDFTVVIWTEGDALSYMLFVAKPVNGLASSENLYIFDGDRDGLICPYGSDGLGVDERFESASRIIGIMSLSGEYAAGLRGPNGKARESQGFSG